MSIFRRDSPSPSHPSSSPGSPAQPSEPAPAREGRATRIAPGTRLRGEVSGAAELVVEGEVEGEIRVGAPVVVGPGGVVRGPISAPVVRVDGKVFGDVRGSERVEVGPAGALEGDIAAPRVVLAEGAFFKGKVEMQKVEMQKVETQRVEMQGDKARGERPPARAAERERARGE